MENFHRDNPDATEAQIEKAQKKNPRRIMESPVVIVVSSEAGKDAMETEENYAACACAVQNILLAAEAVGLGTYWRTGDAAYTSPNAVKELLGVPQSFKIVAFLLVGYPEPSDKTPTRKPLAEKVTWMG
jgi:nitroreductase